MSDFKKHGGIVPDICADLEDVTDDSSYILVDTPLVREAGEENPVFNEASSVANPYARRRSHKNPDGTRGEFPGYVPNKAYIRAASSKQAPRYLFRAVHKGSRGLNREGHYKSQALQAGLGRHDFFGLKDADIKVSLYDHVSQRNCDSHWMSFTDSIVTAMGRANQFFQNDKEDVEVHMVDSFNIKNMALIVHSYAMLRGYRVCVGRAEEQQKKLLGSAYAEFLVWDELVAEAGSVLVKHLFSTGLLQLMPELVLHPEDQIKQKRKFKQPRILRQQLCSVEMKLKEKQKLRDEYYSGPNQGWKRRERAGRFEVKKRDLPPPLIRESYDPRGPLSMHILNKFRALVACVSKPRFQLVLLVALLSMKTNTFCRQQMAEQLAAIPLAAYKSVYMEFFRTVINTPEKRDVQVFQELFTRFMIYARGNRAVNIDAEPESDEDDGPDFSQPALVISQRHGLLTEQFLETSDGASLSKRKRTRADVRESQVSKKRKVERHYHAAESSLTPSLTTSHGTTEAVSIGTLGPATFRERPEKASFGLVRRGMKQIEATQEVYAERESVIEVSKAVTEVVKELETSTKVEQSAKQKMKQHSALIRKQSKTAQKKEEARKKQEKEANESFQRQRVQIQKASGAKKLSWMR